MDSSLRVVVSLKADSIHPRILYELRHELVTPLKILFDTSYKLNQLPAEWNMPILLQSLRKVAKAIHLTIDPSA